MYQSISIIGLTIEVNLQMEARNEDPKTSRNVIAEIRGSVYPEEVKYFFIRVHCS